MNKRNCILISALVCTLCMIFTDGVVKPPYMLKSAVKLIVFGGTVLFYAFIYKEKISVFKIRKESLLKTILLSAGVYFLIIFGYFVTRSFIDYYNIVNTLSSTIGVNQKNFVYVSLYISFINSLLEEIFFRGYCYLTLKKYCNATFSSLFSAALFALYHGGMLDGWFHISAYILLIGLLFAAGLFFNQLDDRRDSVLPSWLPHMFANFGINTVGFILFGAA